jgi:hypothetical protein
MLRSAPLLSQEARVSIKKSAFDKKYLVLFTYLKLKQKTEVLRSTERAK